MAIAAWLACAFGAFDQETGVRLELEERRRVLWVGYSCLLPCAIAAAGVGYATDLVAGASSSNLIVVGLAGGIAVLAIGSLLKITMAGTGIAPQVRPEHAEEWRPKVWPALYLACFGAVLAQPLVALLLSGRLDAKVGEMRGQVLATHEQALHAAAVERLAELAADVSDLTRRLSAARERLTRERAQLAAVPVAAPRTRNAGVTRTIMERAVEDDAAEVEAIIRDLRSAAEQRSALEQAATSTPVEARAYSDNLNNCGFLVERIRFAWRQPLIPLVISVLTALLTGLPLMLRHRLAGAYVRAEHAAQRHAVRSHFLRVDDAVDEVLRRHPTYRGRRREGFADPPFNTEPAEFFVARLGMPSPAVAEDAEITDFLANLPSE